MAEYQKKEQELQESRPQLDKHFMSALQLAHGTVMMLINDFDLGDQQMIDDSIMEFKKICATPMQHYMDFMEQQLAEGRISSIKDAHPDQVRRVDAAVIALNARAERLAEQEVITRKDAEEFMTLLKAVSAQF